MTTEEDTAYEVRFHYGGYLHVYVFFNGVKIGEKDVMVDWFNYERGRRWASRYIRRHKAAIEKLGVNHSTRGVYE